MLPNSKYAKRGLKWKLNHDFLETNAKTIPSSSPLEGANLVRYFGMTALF